MQFSKDIPQKVALTDFNQELEAASEELAEVKGSVETSNACEIATVDRANLALVEVEGKLQGLQTLQTALENSESDNDAFGSSVSFIPSLAWF